MIVKMSAVMFRFETILGLTIAQLHFPFAENCNISPDIRRVGILRLFFIN